MAEDLAQETLADLVSYLRGRPSPPPDETWALASTILRRRIADQHRGALRKIVQTFSPDDLPDAPSNDDVEHVSAVRQLLWVVLGFLSELNARERTLLLGDEASTGAESALSAADRKRLSRLRAGLRNQVRDRLGPGADKILRD